MQDGNEFYIEIPSLNFTKPVTSAGTDKNIAYFTFWICTWDAIHLKNRLRKWRIVTPIGSCEFKIWSKKSETESITIQCIYNQRSKMIKVYSGSFHFKNLLYKGKLDD